MSVDSQGRVSETDLASLSECDRFSLDDAGTDCSCSSCSSCSTCSLCEEEDGASGACGSSCGEDEYFEERNESYDYREDVQAAINGRVVGRRDMRYRNEEAVLNDHQIEKKDVRSETHGFTEERLLQFSSHGQGKQVITQGNYVCNKLTNPRVQVNGVHEKHSISNGTVTTPVHTLRLEELSLQEGGVKTRTGWLNGLSPKIHDNVKKRKKVTFVDSSSSSDEVMFTEQFSRASGWSPCHCSAKGDIVQHGGKFPVTGVNETQRGAKTSTVDMNLEYARLKNVLKTIDPSKLHAILKHALKSKKPEVVDALGTLLPKSKFTADTIHCVRCHKEFDPIYGKKECLLPHPEKSVLKVSQDLEGADFACSICVSSFRLKGAWDYRLSANAEQDCGVCFLGKHTPNTEEVEFGPSGAAQSCEDKGCIVFYV